MDEKQKAEELAAQEAAKVKAEADAKAKAEEEANAPLKALAERDEQIAKLKEERDNYKNVALKRLGKLPGDAGFIETADEKTGLTVEETVKKTLLEREIAQAEAVKEAENQKLAKENVELRLALKNRPQASNGGGGGESLEVKDNVLSEQQIEVLRQKAIRLKADPEKFIETAKKNLLNHR
jgi:hypothetical protein